MGRGASEQAGAGLEMYPLLSASRLSNLNNTILYYTILYYTILYYTTLYYTIP